MVDAPGKIGGPGLRRFWYRGRKFRSHDRGAALKVTETVTWGMGLNGAKQWLGNGAWFRKVESLAHPTLCDPMDCSPPGSSDHEIFQARILEWVAIAFSRGSSRPRDRTWVSHIVGRCLRLWRCEPGCDNKGEEKGKTLEVKTGCDYWGRRSLMTLKLSAWRTRWMVVSFTGTGRNERTERIRVRKRSPRWDMCWIWGTWQTTVGDTK